MKKIFRTLFIVLCFVQYGHSLTLSNIRSAIRVDIRDTNSDRWTDAQLLTIINEAQREINNATWILEKTTSYVLSPLTTSYYLPTDIIAVNQVLFKDSNGQERKLEERTRASLIDNNPNWRRSNAQPTEYFVERATVATLAQWQINYIPIPTNTSTGTVTLFYVSQAADLSADSDVPFDSKSGLIPFHQAIIYQAVMRIKAIENKFQAAQFYGQLYINYLNFIKEKANALPNYSPSFRASP